jgi:hypothetical protein
VPLANRPELMTDAQRTPPSDATGEEFVSGRMRRRLGSCCIRRLVLIPLDVAPLDPPK